MVKKSFFKERTVNDIRKLSVIQVDRQRGLVERIDNLDPGEEAIELRMQREIVPERFFRNVETGREASRKCLKHGALIKLSQPQSQDSALRTREIPLAMRARDFADLEAMREEDINFVGYSFRPVQGRDRTLRVVPFVWMPEGVRLFGYAESRVGGIKVQSYKDSARVQREGASIVLEVPSRSRKVPRYRFGLRHVPVLRGNENLASVLSLRPFVLQESDSGEPIRGRTAHEDFLIRYTGRDARQESPVITFYPHDLAGYLGIVKNELSEHNLTPLEMNPFALPSRKQAEFYKKLYNNVLVYDLTLSSKSKLRKLHLAERCILLARAIGKFGHDEFAFWDGPRDGRLRDYDWSV